MRPRKRQKRSSLPVDDTAMSTCLVCFETKPLKIVGSCRHSFCTDCLSTVLGNENSGSEVFACPSCKADCARPQDGVEGLVDFMGDEIPVKSEEETKSETTENNIDVICDICDVRKIKAAATSTCPECRDLHICKDCSRTHSANKATRFHLLSPVVSKTQVKKEICKEHNKLLICYCQTCETEACNICVSLHHGDHDVEKLADTIRSRIEVVKTTLGSGEDKLKEMEEMQNELTRAMAMIADQQDTLIKEIEDHAGKCIAKIIKWKENLKTQVKVEYEIVREIPEFLEKFSKDVEKLKSAIKTAGQLLSETEHHPMYLDKLNTMQLDLEATLPTEWDGLLRGSEFLCQISCLDAQDHSFAPDNTPIQYGKIHKSATFEPKEIFQHKLPVDSEDSFIPCIALLGREYYAVAHPGNSLHLTPDAIDIYKFPGILKNTFRGLSPVYDIASTPAGKLAVLSNPGKHGVRFDCSLKLFDPETGYISCTKDIDVSQPLSLAVTQQNQYIILGWNASREKEITVVDKDGAVEGRYVIDDYEDVYNVKQFTRIACGGRFLFVKGKYMVLVHEMTETGLDLISTWPPKGTFTGKVTDLTATTSGDLFLTDVTGENGEKGQVCLNRLEDTENKKGWAVSSFEAIRTDVTGADRVTRVSTRDGHTIVVSQGHTIKIFKC